MKRSIGAILGLFVLALGGALADGPGDDDPYKTIARRAASLPSHDLRGKIRTLKELEKMGSLISSLVCSLSFALGDPDESVRFQAARDLTAIGPSAHWAVPQLVHALKDPSGEVREAAAAALGSIGPFAQKNVSALIPLLKDAVPQVRAQAAVSLGRVGAKEAVGALIECLKDNSKTIRGTSVSYDVAGALGQIGPEAKLAIPALLEIIKNGDVADTRAHAVVTLGAIGDENMIPVLIEALRKKDLRAPAASALSRFGPKAEMAVPALIEALKAKDVTNKDHYTGTQCNILLTLGIIGPPAKAAIPEIKKLLIEPAKTDAQKVVAACAESALKKIDKLH